MAAGAPGTIARRRRWRGMNVKRSISTIAAVTALAATGVAGAADAPVVSGQHFIAGAAPITIPGTGIEQGEWMGSKSLAVYRHVTLEAGQKARVTLRAPGGRKVRGVALSSSKHVGSRVAGGAYVGKRQVIVELTARASAPAGEHEVTVYALAN